MNKMKTYICVICTNKPLQMLVENIKLKTLNDHQGLWGYNNI